MNWPSLKKLPTAHQTSRLKVGSAGVPLQLLRDQSPDAPAAPGQSSDQRGGNGTGPNGSGTGRGRLGPTAGKGLGYVPDIADGRDVDWDKFEFRAFEMLAEKLHLDPAGGAKGPGADELVRRYRAALTFAFGDAIHPPVGRGGPLPTSVDLRSFMPPIDDQASLQCCTICAVSALIEYVQIVARGAYLPISRLFSYKATRKLMGIVGDSGAYIRDTLKATAMLGTCPEQYWPFDPARFDDVPDAFCFAVASGARSISYARLGGGQPRNDLACAKKAIAAGLPVVIGFTCYASIDGIDVSTTGQVPYPMPGERAVGGHAVLAVGFQDLPESELLGGGCLIIRNSWGPSWGDHGYGQLPYAYIAGSSPDTVPLATDLWTLAVTVTPDVPGTVLPPYAAANGR